MYLNIFISKKLLSINVYQNKEYMGKILYRVRKNRLTKIIYHTENILWGELGDRLLLFTEPRKVLGKSLFQITDLINTFNLIEGE